MTDTPDLRALVERLEDDGELCPFCGHDPYHYVDIGVGMQKAAVVCCGPGIALIQDRDPILIAEIDLRAEAAAALTTLQHQLAEMEEAQAWKPIETAPKGRRVLVFIPRADHPENLPVGTPMIAYQTDHGAPFQESWRYAGGLRHGDQCGWPSHWMELAEPPSRSTIKDRGEGR